MAWVDPNYYVVHLRLSLAYATYWPVLDEAVTGIFHLCGSMMLSLAYSTYWSVASILYILVCVWHTPHIGLWLDDAVTGILHVLVCGWHTRYLVYCWTMLSLAYSKHWSVVGILHILVYSWMFLSLAYSTCVVRCCCHWHTPHTGLWLNDAVVGILHILVHIWI